MSTSVFTELTFRYEKLQVIVGEQNAGKTSLIRKLAAEHDATSLNLNLELSKRLLSISKADWQLQLKGVLQDILSEQTQPIAFLDNTEILFDIQLQVNPLRLLKDLSRNQIIVASWNGHLHNGQLIYARPGHPEYRVETNIDFPIIDLNQQKNYENKESNA